MGVFIANPSARFRSLYLYPNLEFPPPESERRHYSCRFSSCVTLELTLSAYPNATPFAIQTGQLLGSKEQN